MICESPVSLLAYFLHWPHCSDWICFLRDFWRVDNGVGRLLTILGHKPAGEGLTMTIARLEGRPTTARGLPQ
jgi:hypothetical protein